MILAHVLCARHFGWRGSRNEYQVATTLNYFDPRENKLGIERDRSLTGPAKIGPSRG